MENLENNLYLVFIVPLNKNKAVDDIYEYMFLFSETPDVVWGVDWEINNLASTYENINECLPDKSTYSKIYKIKTKIPFKTIEELSCFSMEYAIDRIVALGFFDITNLEEYPENGRLVFKFGDNIEKVKSELSKYSIELEDA